MINAPYMSYLEKHDYERGAIMEYRGFGIVPKRDFGARGYYVAEFRTCVNAGWVIVYNDGPYKGCNALPGATFAWSLAGAHDAIDDLIAVGGEQNHRAWWERQKNRKVV